MSKLIALRAMLLLNKGCVGEACILIKGAAPKIYENHEETVAYLVMSLNYPDTLDTVKLSLKACISNYLKKK